MATRNSETVGRMEGTLEVVVDNIKSLNSKTGELSERVARQEEKINHVDERLESIEKKLDSMLESKFIKDDPTLFTKVFLKKEPLLLLAVFTTSIYALIPKDFDITKLWDMVKKLVGI